MLPSVAKWLAALTKNFPRSLISERSEPISERSEPFSEAQPNHLMSAANHLMSAANHLAERRLEQPEYPFVFVGPAVGVGKAMALKRIDGKLPVVLTEVDQPFG